MTIHRTTFRLSALLAPLVLSVLFPAAARAGEKSLINTTQSPHAVMYMPDLADVRWNGGLWGERFETCRTVMIPHMWTILSDKNESHAWDNFLMAAGRGEGRGDGKPHGPPFNDGDFLKWLESLAQVYAVTHDPKIDAQMDAIIAIIVLAQREDGYLHTQKIIPQRRDPANPANKELQDREHFETYNMGHLMTTACIHYRATGKTTLLEAAKSAAHYLYQLCIKSPRDIARNAVCPSHYMGLIELYRTTHIEHYRELARALVELRGIANPGEGSDHNQDRLPFRKMTEAVGHAVRANYLYAGVADLYAENGDKTLLAPLTQISNNVSGQKLYVTGMTGAIYDGASPDGAPSGLHHQIKTVHQAYGRDYQLPNLTAYNETCATIGYAMWMSRMLALSGDAHYADLIEQTLYNGVLPSISLEGKDYFYVNPLRKDADFKYPLRWSRTRQPNYKSSFCCPPNIIRTIAEAHNYVYSLSADKLWVHLYGANTLDTAWLDGSRIKLHQTTDYPYSGTVTLTIDEAPARPIALKLRIPGWLKPGQASLSINGQKVPPTIPLPPGTYADLKNTWKKGDTIQLDLNFAPVLLEANPLVEETVNQVAIKFGPLVYCLEANDLPPGTRVRDIALALDPGHRQFTLQTETIAATQLLTLTLPAFSLPRPVWQPGQLYRELSTEPPHELRLKLIPYFAWGNRGDTDMSIWLPAR